jgi:hypothetical protein
MLLKENYCQSWAFEVLFIIKIDTKFLKVEIIFSKQKTYGVIYMLLINTDNIQINQEKTW